MEKKGRKNYTISTLTKVLEAIEDGYRNRKDLFDYLKINRITLYEILNDLIKIGVIFESEKEIVLLDKRYLYFIGGK